MSDALQERLVICCTALLSFQEIAKQKQDLLLNFGEAQNEALTCSMRSGNDESQ